MFELIAIGLIRQFVVHLAKLTDIISVKSLIKTSALTIA